MGRAEWEEEEEEEEEEELLLVVLLLVKGVVEGVGVSYICHCVLKSKVASMAICINGLFKRGRGTKSELAA